VWIVERLRKEDVTVTETIEATAKTIGIPLLDHIVVARDISTSIFEGRKKKGP
jgi:DNA repair protein RadC